MTSYYAYHFRLVQRMVFHEIVLLKSCLGGGGGGGERERGGGTATRFHDVHH